MKSKSQSEVRPEKQKKICAVIIDGETFFFLLMLSMFFLVWFM